MNKIYYKEDVENLTQRVELDELLSMEDTQERRKLITMSAESGGERKSKAFWDLRISPKIGMREERFLRSSVLPIISEVCVNGIAHKKGAVSESRGPMPPRRAHPPRGSVSESRGWVFMSPLKKGSQLLPALHIRGVRECHHPIYSAMRIFSILFAVDSLFLFPPEEIGLRIS